VFILCLFSDPEMFLVSSHPVAKFSKHPKMILV